MKRGGELKRSAMKPGTKGLKRSPMARGDSMLARTHMARRTGGFKDTVPLGRHAAPAPADTVEQAKPKKRSRGLKGRPPTAAERAFMDLAGQVPCMACMKDGRENRHISLHHVDGRTKPGAHFLVLPLCGPHHQQDDSDPLERVSLHGAKKVFGQLYGSEQELLVELYAMLKFSPPGETACP